MIFPSIEQLTKDIYNRYELVIATAKVARVITDKLNEKKEEMERIISIRESTSTDKAPPAQREIKDFPEEKPVKSAIQKIFEGEFLIIAE